MHFAVIGDIDCDLPCAMRVLDAIEDEGILTILHTGNTLAGAGDPTKLLDRLEQLQVRAVQGPLDRVVSLLERKRSSLERRFDEEILRQAEHVAARLRPEHLERLRNRPKTLSLTLEETSVLLTHRSPINEREPLDADTPTVKLQRIREVHPVDIVIAGGAADSWSRSVEGTLFLNAGPLERDNTFRYLVIDTEQQPVRVLVRELA